MKNLLKLIQNIKAAFRKHPKELWPDSRFVIKHAFRACGKDYYMMDDMVNLPYERALTAIDFYNEFSMGVDIEFLKLHTAKIRELLTTKKTINVFEINKLNEQLAEKVDFIRSPNLIYKLASVVYFDKSEDPTTYDFKYNDEKIKRWKSEFKEGSFFLLKPIKDLVPFLAESQLNLKTYLEMWEKVEKVHLEGVSLQLSGNSNSNEKQAAVK